MICWRFPIPITNQAKGFTYRYRLDGTDIYITGGGPSPYSPFQEIFIEFMGSEYISPGIWKISLEPISVKDGSWDIGCRQVLCAMHRPHLSMHRLISP